MTIFAALFIWFMAFDVFFMEIQSSSNSWYLLDLFQQSIAFYFQKVVQISQHLDVFQRLDEGIDNGQQRLTAWFVGWEGSGWVMPADSSGNDSGAVGGALGGQWGWSMSLTPFAGLWIARVSKGRTIKQVIHYGLVFPMFVCFAWIAIFGGSALKMQRQAILDACRCSCSEVGPQRQLNGRQPPSTTNNMIPFNVKYAALCERIASNPFGDKPMEANWQGTGRYGEPHVREEKVCSRQRPDGCASIILLSLRRPEVRLYDLLDQYEKEQDKPGTKNVGPFLSGLVLVALLVLTAACSVAGTSVITLLLSSGDESANVPVRFLALVTQLSLTSALLRAGVGSPIFDPITLLQSLSAVAGIVFMFLLMFFPTAFVLLVRENPSAYPSLAKPQNKEEEKDATPRLHNEDWDVAFVGGFLDVIERIFSGFQFSLPPEFFAEIFRFTMALLFPYAILPIAYSRIQLRPTMFPLLAVWMFFFWWMWICLHIVEAAPYWRKGKWQNKSEGMWSLAWASYCFFVAAVASCRNCTRRTYCIPGSLWIDVLLSLLFYPLVICQISAQEILITDDPQCDPNYQAKPAAQRPVPLQHSDAAMKKEKEIAHVQYSSRDREEGSTAPQRSDVYTVSQSQRSTHRQLYASGKAVWVLVGPKPCPRRHVCLDRFLAWSAARGRAPCTEKVHFYLPP
jgi:hypothetical protein